MAERIYRFFFLMKPSFPTETTIDLDLVYLEAHLAGLDLRLHAQVQRWQRAGQDPGDEFRGLYVSDAQAGALLARPLGGHWGHGVELEPSENEAIARARVQIESRIAELARRAADQDRELRLDRLVRLFDLSEFERDVLLLVIAPVIDLRYERLYGYLQDDVTRKRPGINLALDLLCTGMDRRLDGQRVLAGQSPLFAHFLVTRQTDERAGSVSILNSNLVIDPTVEAWLLGAYLPAPAIEASVRVFPALGSGAEPSYPAWESLPPHLEEFLFASSPGTPDRPDPPVFAFYGLDSLVQQHNARRLAANMQRPLLLFDLEYLQHADVYQTSLLKRALRDALLMDALPFVSGWENLLVDGAPPAADLEVVLDFPGPIVVASREAWLAQSTERSRRLAWFDFPLPTPLDRRTLWARLIEAENLPSAEIDRLAGHFNLSSSQIHAAAAAAHDAAAQAGRLLTGEDLFAAARAFSNPRLSNLARKIPPRYDWADIVLPEDQRALLREIVATVNQRTRVLDEWGLARKLVPSRGVTVLFAGPPGTGKTMAAEVIAAELGLDLYKIDLSTVVSKYIGETEKNLERLFDEAATSNAILFFDEADALFGKRSEVRDSHDRYANLEISYLLQRMEAYDGVTILATNLRANLDEAFTRRLQFAVDFPFPEEEDRLRIWQSLFPPGVPQAPGLDLVFMARRFKLAGGNIRNVLVNAAYLAAADGGVVKMEHLLHGTRRELQKMGRLVNEPDLARSDRNQADV